PDFPTAGTAMTTAPTSPSPAPPLPTPPTLRRRCMPQVSPLHVLNVRATRVSSYGAAIYRLKTGRGPRAIRRSEPLWRYIDSDELLRDRADNRREVVDCALSGLLKRIQGHISLRSCFGFSEEETGAKT